MSYITSSVATFQSFSLGVWGPLDNATQDSRESRLTLGPYNASNRIRHTSIKSIKLPDQQRDYLGHLAGISCRHWDSQGATIGRFLPGFATVQEILPDLWDVENSQRNSWPERVDLACRANDPWEEISQVSQPIQRRRLTGCLATFAAIRSVFPDLWDQVDNSPEDPWPRRSVGLLVHKRDQPAPIARPDRPDDDDDDDAESVSWRSATESEWENDFESDWDVDSGIVSWSDASSASGDSNASEFSGGEVDHWE